MFCNSCEKYLNTLESVCSICSTPCEERRYKKSVHEKIYTAEKKIEAAKKARVRETCPDCGSEHMYFYTMQLRSADEGQTVFYECDCGHKSRLNT